MEFTNMFREKILSAKQQLAVVTLVELAIVCFHILNGFYPHFALCTLVELSIVVKVLSQYMTLDVTLAQGLILAY